MIEIEPPKKEPELVPFDSTREFLDWYCAKYNWSLRGMSFPTIWLREISSGNVYSISEFWFKDVEGVTINIVTVGVHSYKTYELLKYFTLLDGTPIGKEK